MARRCACGQTEKRSHQTPKVGIYGASSKKLMPRAWAHALSRYLSLQPPYLLQLGRNIAILSKSGKMAHAMISDNKWVFMSNAWFKAGVPDKILDDIVQFIKQHKRSQDPRIIRHQATEFYRRVYLKIPYVLKSMA